VGTTIRPLRDSLKIWAAYERDRHANPTTPRPYRPFLEPPTTPPPDAGTPDRLALLLEAGPALIQREMTNHLPPRTNQ
jgi:hypothetical protein